MPRGGPPHHHPEQLDGLQRKIEQMDLLRDHPDRFLDLGRDFHDGLAGLLGDQRCQAILRQIRSPVDRYWALKRHAGRSGPAAPRPSTARSFP
jgi:DNA-binding GntR family transcriptional regulator